MKKTLSQIAFACCATVSVAAPLQEPRADGDDFYEAVYQVPMQSSESTHVSQFAMDPVELAVQGHHVKMQYLLPVELTGEENVISMEGDLDQGQGHLQYGNSDSTCTTEKNVLTCKVIYSNLKINSSLAEKFLGQKFSGVELDKRISVQREFSTDPVGIVQVKLD